MTSLTRAIQVFKEQGFFELLRKSVGLVYRKYFRQYFPTSNYYMENSVIVEQKYLFDGILLPYKSDVPEQEGGIVSSHQEVTKSGDVVVVVGGGKGITAVRAAEIVGKQGEVAIYEGGRESVEKIERVIQFNGVNDFCEVHHAVVGTERDVYGGESTTADIVQPNGIPECDVLELDCEGSEIDILRELPIHPRAIIVELHPWNFQDEPDTILEILFEMGYELTHRFGHDGNPLSEKEFETLLSNSNVQGERYVESGGRWPVVIVAVLSET